MYPTNLTTNEIKNSSGTEEEFLRVNNAQPLLFRKSGMAPNRPHEISLMHDVSGVGVSKTRRSKLETSKVVTGVDGNPAQIRWYTVGVIPEGNLADTTEVKNSLANHISNLASQGANTTILFDCSGYGADALVNGTN